MFTVVDEGGDGSFYAFSVRTPQLLNVNTFMTASEIAKLASESKEVVSEERFCKMVAHLAALVRKYNVKRKFQTPLKDRIAEPLRQHFAEEDLSSYHMAEPSRFYNHGRSWFVYINSDHYDTVFDLLVKGINSLSV